MDSLVLKKNETFIGRSRRTISFYTLIPIANRRKVSRRPSRKIGNLHLQKSKKFPTTDKTRVGVSIFSLKFSKYSLNGRDEQFLRAPSEMFGHIQCLLEEK